MVGFFGGGAQGWGGYGKDNGWGDDDATARRWKQCATAEGRVGMATVCYSVRQGTWIGIGELRHHRVAGTDGHDGSRVCATV